MRGQRLVVVQRVEMEQHLVFVRVSVGGCEMILNTEKNRSTSFTLAAASWGSSQTVNGRTVYVQTISVTEISEPHPEWGLLSATGAIPSEAEEEAFGTLVALTVDATENEMKVYASETPAIDIVICVKGVK